MYKLKKEIVNKKNSRIITLTKSKLKVIKFLLLNKLKKILN